MPSALGSSSAGGQEGYDLAAATASSTTANTISPHNTDIALQELHNNNTLQANRAATDANRLAAIHLLSAATALDGSRDSNELGGLEANANVNVRINSGIQDSPAHENHVQTEATNETHAQLKKDTETKEIRSNTMADQIPAAAATTPLARPEVETGNSLADLEKIAQPQPNASHFERSMSADEKAASPPQVTPAAIDIPLPDTTSSPSARSSPQSQQQDSALALNITLLLPTGARHAFRITESYLTKRGVSIPGVDDKGIKDVYSVSVYQIKELILREWKEEWGGETTVSPQGDSVEVEAGRMRGKPSSPAAIRLIFFGRLLGDGDKVEGKSQLTAFIFRSIVGGRRRERMRRILTIKQIADSTRPQQMLCT